MKDTNGVTAIVSVYNEEQTIKEVVVSLLNCELIHELIVVNDGSTDNTTKILKKLLKSFHYRYIEFEKNVGKSYAMVAGVRNATCNIILFVDGDIIGLNDTHIGSLLYPLIAKQADMVIGHRFQRKNPGLNIADPLDKWLGGERALFKKDIYPILNKIEHTKFGIETLMNMYYKNNKKKITLVDLEGLVHIQKYKKYKIHTSLVNYTKELFQITKTIMINYLLLFDITRNIIINLFK